MGNPIKFVSTIALFLTVSGCAIYYRDAETEAEHIWGLAIWLPRFQRLKAANRR